MGSIIGAGASIVGGILGSNASSKAAAAQQQALQQALGFQQQVYGTAQQNLNPYISGGQTALQSLLGAYGLGGSGAGGVTNAFNSFMQTPAYQFPQQQGMLGINRQLASMGLTGSGAALRDAATFNSGLASQGYNTFLGGISGIAGAGQNAAQALGGLGNQAGSTLGNLYGQYGNAGAAGIIGSNTAMNQGFGQALGYLHAPMSS